MFIKIFKDNKALGAWLAQRIKELILRKPAAVLGLATGDSPVSTYDALVRLVKEGLDLSQVTTFNLDEYIDCPLPEETYRFFMENHLFEPAGIKKEKTHFPSPLHLAEYDAMIERAGGIDLQILGIGLNGHIGFNEPGTPFGLGTHVVELTSSTKEANKRFFHDDVTLVPQKAVTMGPATIKKARSIFLIANTPNKKEAVLSLLKNEMTPLMPASILKDHPSCTILLTEKVGIDPADVR